MILSEIETIIDIPAEALKAVFGNLDENIRKIEKNLYVKILAREGQISVIGSETQPRNACKIIQDLARTYQNGNEIDPQNVDYAIALAKENSDHHVSELDSDIICRTVNGKPIKPKTFHQKSYTDAIRNNMIVFGLGPAGTGKTYLAMAMAIDAFKQGQVNRIILTRPAIEAGENLGFLPGDLQQKVDPYLRPLYDAIYQIMGAESYLSNSEKGLIEVAPLAYMRGRTLDNAFIILDEAQNTTSAQMKMFLTRIGFGSKVIVTGDLTQKDLPFDSRSGLEVAVDVLRKIDDIAFCTLTSRDVVRHPLVQKIVQAYEAYEQRNHDADIRKRDRYHTGPAGRERRSARQESH